MLTWKSRVPLAEPYIKINNFFSCSLKLHWAVCSYHATRDLYKDKSFNVISSNLKKCTKKLCGPVSLSICKINLLKRVEARKLLKQSKD